MNVSSRSRKRDAVLRIFRGAHDRPSTSATNAVTPTTQTSVSQNTFCLSTQLPTTQRPSTILDDALNELTGKQQTAIQEKLPHNATDASVTLREACETTKVLQESCKDRSWRWTYRGRDIMLRDEIGKILRLMERFVAVGDVVANVDPVHVGLPWAGIRSVLQVGLFRRTCLFVDTNNA